MLSALTTSANALTHGWSGLVFGYSVVAAPMVTAMVRGRAGLQKLLWSPLLAVPVSMMAGLATAIAQPALRGLGVASGSLMEIAAGIGVCSAVGYLSGRVLAKSSSSTVSYGRGAHLELRFPADRTTRGDPYDRVAIPSPATPAADRDPLGTSQHRACRPEFRDRAATGPQRVSQARLQRVLAPGHVVAPAVEGGGRGDFSRTRRRKESLGDFPQSW